jgi:ABC-type transport system involved in multi-copper enzyme maturation permease subunit
VTRQLASELVKIRTIRGGYWIAAATLGLVAIATFSVIASEAADVLAAFDEQRQLVRIAAIADVFAVLLGIVLMGGEQSHGTITQTFLVQPVRERVLAAKALVAAGLGAALAVAAVALVLLIAAPWLSARGIDLELGDAQLRRIMLGTVLAAALAAVVGVGCGAFFHGQGSAIAAVLIYLLIGENVLQPVLGDDREYTPAASFAAVVNAARTTDPDSGLLPMWTGLLLAVAYTGAFLLVGIFVLSRRDV